MKLAAAPGEISPPPPPAAAGSPAVVTLNVGGQLFTTRRSTLAAVEGSFLAALLSERFRADRDAQGNLFIDRDPAFFAHILAWLVRDGGKALAHGAFGGWAVDVGRVLFLPAGPERPGPGAGGCGGERRFFPRA